jgi:DNA invertase Pin-like site-specific DNA recombinase
MRVIPLFRVSTEKQANEGASLDAQERKYLDLASQEAWDTVEVFRGSESAAKESRERVLFQQLLHSVRQHNPDAIYVHEQSRLTRGDELDVALLLRELRDRGVKVIVGGLVRDLSSIDERFMFRIHGAVDRAEYERITERTMRGRIEKARQGKKTSGRAPYGYRNPPPGDPLRGSLQVVPEQGAVVRRIYELAASGATQRQICASLNGEGIPAPKGGEWGRSTIRRILSNPAYRGIQASRVWVADPVTSTVRFEPDNPQAIIVEEAHQPIVGHELWEAAKLPGSNSPGRPGLLTGLLWINGRRVRIDRSRGRSFYCSREVESGNPWVPVETMNELVWEAFTRLISGPPFISALVEQAKDTVAPESIRDAIERRQRLALKLQRRLNTLINMRADGEITKEQYLDRAAKTNAQVRQVNSEIQRHKAKLARIDGSEIERAVLAVQKVLKNSTTLDTPRKSQLLGSLVQQVKAVVRRNPVAQPRDNAGRYATMSEPTWHVQDLDFELDDGDPALNTNRFSSDRQAPVRRCWRADFPRYCRV